MCSGLSKSIEIIAEQSSMDGTDEDTHLNASWKTCSRCSSLRTSARPLQHSRAAASAIPCRRNRSALDAKTSAASCARGVENTEPSVPEESESVEVSPSSWCSATLRERRGCKGDSRRPWSARQLSPCLLMVVGMGFDLLTLALPPSSFKTKQRKGRLRRRKNNFQTRSRNQVQVLGRL